MDTTKHMQQRMAERTISKVAVDLTELFGVDYGDKVILNRRAAGMARAALCKAWVDFQKQIASGQVSVVS